VNSPTLAFDANNIDSILAAMQQPEPVPETVPEPEPRKREPSPFELRAIPMIEKIVKIPKTFTVSSSPGKAHFYFNQTDASIAMGNQGGKSPAQVEFSDVLARLDPAQCLVVNAWFKSQRRLKNEGDEGFSNFSEIVSWLLDRRYGVTEAGLDMALTNVQNNSRRKLFWHEGPKQSREYVQGKPNHAFGEEAAKPTAAQKEFHPNGRRNHSYVPPENAAKKPAEAPDAWHQICKLHLKEWVTEGQRAKLEAEYNSGISTGKSWREIGAALGQIVKGWERGR
jgi:hypothetical protein